MVTISDILQYDVPTLSYLCYKYKINDNIKDRWEKGIEHHSETAEIFSLIQKVDWIFGNDYFEWKSGGDGDNGEHLMSCLSIIFELRDALNRD